MKIAIIGGGIVGSTAAFYASLAFDDVTLYDEGTGQATKAAAGIICPWFSKRRNQAWYRLANEGAHFYAELIQDLAALGQKVTSYQNKPCWLLKKREYLLDELKTLAEQRRDTAPLIGPIERLTPAAQKACLAPWAYEQDVLAITSGAAILNGEKFCQELQAAALRTGKLTIHHTQAKLEPGKLVNGTYYDKIFLATGAWLNNSLKPLGLSAAIKPQKGMLAVYQADVASWPLIMPEGEADIIPHGESTLYLGASHENDKGFDLSLDPSSLNAIFATCQTLLPSLLIDNYTTLKVGTRAYSKDFAPFYGPLPTDSSIYVASGLGSSGLTTGPLIAREVIRQMLGQKTQLPAKDYSPSPYITAQ